MFRAPLSPVACQRCPRSAARLSACGRRTPRIRSAGAIRPRFRYHLACQSSRHSAQARILTEHHGAPDKPASARPEGSRYADIVRLQAHQIIWKGGGLGRPACPGGFRLDLFRVHTCGRALPTCGPSSVIAPRIECRKNAGVLSGLLQVILRIGLGPRRNEEERGDRVVAGVSLFENGHRQVLLLLEAEGVE